MEKDFKRKDFDNDGDIVKQLAAMMAMQKMGAIKDFKVLQYSDLLKTMVSDVNFGITPDGKFVMLEISNFGGTNAKFTFMKNSLQHFLETIKNMNRNLK